MITPAPVEPSDDFRVRVVGVPPGYRVWEPAVLSYRQVGGRMAIKFSVYLEPIPEEKPCFPDTGRTFGFVRPHTRGQR